MRTASSRRRRSGPGTRAPRSVSCSRRRRPGSTSTRYSTRARSRATPTRSSDGSTRSCRSPRSPRVEVRDVTLPALDRYEISTDPARLDLDVIHRYLSQESYWAKGRTREDVARSIEHSVAFGVYLDGRQVGFARAVTDRTTFAWLADVFVLPEHRGHGLGKRLVEAALTTPELTGVYRWVLGTADAQGLYARYGFRPPSGDRFMVRESVDEARRCAGG